MTQLRLILAIAALGACVGAFFFGLSVGEDRTVARYARVQDKLEKAVQANVRAAQANDLAAAAAAQRTDTISREIRRDVPTIIDRPVYRNICIDADGVRRLDRAVDAANGRGDAAGGDDGPPGGLREGPGADRPGDG